MLQLGSFFQLGSTVEAFLRRLIRFVDESLVATEGVGDAMGSCIMIVIVDDLVVVSCEEWIDLFSWQTGFDCETTGTAIAFCVRRFVVLGILVE